MNCFQPTTFLPLFFVLSVFVGGSRNCPAEDVAVTAEVTEGEIREALSRATEFMTTTVADHGGYAWVSSADGRLSHGEGACDDNRVWVQPPGTPAVGQAFLNAYQATGDAVHLDAAKAVAKALVDGQLRSGGWGYSIEFDPDLRAKVPYRVTPLGAIDRIAKTPEPGGWDVWRKREYRLNKTVIDDDTTPAAIRFLVRLDQQLEFKDESIHDAIEYALRSTLGAQYPIGAWSHNYDRFAWDSPSSEHYPEIAATIDPDWSRTWTKDYSGCYMLNDRITQNMIQTMLVAWQVYGDQRFLDSALRGGDFLLMAQLPEPQPAWAQQYDRHMRPVWDRKFEPPAVTSGESQDTINTLLNLYVATGEQRFLKPVARSIEYLKTLLRPDGKLARYYELETDKPIYFNQDYQITSDDSQMPDHYAFLIDSKLDSLRSRYDRLVVVGTESKTTVNRKSTKRAMSVIAQQNADGSWLVPGFVRDSQSKKTTPHEGVVDSATVINNYAVLCETLTGKPVVK